MQLETPGRDTRRGANPPTGADGEHATFCRLCEAHCGLVATVREGRVVKLAPDRDNPHSLGHVCVKGTSAAQITYDPDRVLKPLKRVGGAGEFVEVGWDQALDDIAATLKRIRREHGAEAIASYLGNPTSFASENFITQLELMAAMGSTRQYGASSQDTSARLLANHLAYGAPWTTGMPDLPSCDFLLIMGGNPMVSNGSLMWAPRIAHDLDAIAARGRVVVVDPRRSETAARYEHLPIQPNGDVWLLLGLLRVLLDETLLDEALLAASVSGWPALRGEVSRRDVEHCAVACGVPAQAIRELARGFVTARRASIYGRIGICRGPYATLVNFLLTAFNAITGSYDREGGTMFGREVFPREKPVVGGYGEARTRIGGVPAVAGFLASATMPDDILVDGPDKVRALLVTCGNPLLSAPGGERLEEALQALELMVSFDLYVNETNRLAHYILPGTSFLERADAPVIGFGFMIRPFLQYSDAVIKPLGEARDEFDSYLAIVRRMGLGAPAASKWRRRLGKWLRWTPRPLTLVDIGLRLGPVGDRFGLRRDGWSFKRLRAHPHGVMVDLPHPSKDWRERIAWPDRRIHVWHEVIEREFARLGADVAPREKFRLLSVREIRSLNSWMHNVGRLVRSQKPKLTMHPEDARELGVGEGDAVWISTAVARLQVPVTLSDEVVRGAVCYPHGWGHRGGSWQTANRTEGVNINRLLGLGLDAIEFVSGSSLIDGLPVSIERVGPAQADVKIQDRAA
nr:molybdopterin-dependent oxidoreductase [Solimonas terrae]